MFYILATDCSQFAKSCDDLLASAGWATASPKPEQISPITQIFNILERIFFISG